MRLATAGDEITAARDSWVLSRINDVELLTMRAICSDCGKPFEVPISFVREG